MEVCARDFQWYHSCLGVPQQHQKAFLEWNTEDKDKEGNSACHGVNVIPGPKKAQVWSYVSVFVSQLPPLILQMCLAEKQMRAAALSTAGHPTPHFRVQWVTWLSEMWSIQTPHRVIEGDRHIWQKTSFFPISLENFKPNLAVHSCAGKSVNQELLQARFKML